MAELLVIRHGQASFGTDNYDRLSELGHRQARAAGDLLRALGWIPDRLVTGTLLRQRETLASMGFDSRSEEHAGFNEYDFDDLLYARFGGQFQITSRLTASRISAICVTWCWNGRLAASVVRRKLGKSLQVAWRPRRFAIKANAKRVLVISSGGVIAHMTAKALDAPDAQMMQLNLQIKNSSLTRFIFYERAFYLHEFNAVPHLMSQEGQEMLTYS